MVERKKRFFLESLFLFSALFMVALLLIVLYGSMQYWVANFPYGTPTSSILFYLAIGIAIVTSIAQWIEGRTKSIMESVANIKKIRRRSKNAKRNGRT